MSEEKWVTVAKRAELGEGDMKGTTLNDVEIAVYNIDGTLYATDNLCTHAFAFLTDGWLDGDVIECPLHGGRFEVKTGKGLGPPIPCDIKIYPLRVVGDEIQVNLGG
jgi:nitrite reductase/ring-hydroxylating ferredoxin subunit